MFFKVICQYENLYDTCTAEQLCDFMLNKLFANRVNDIDGVSFGKTISFNKSIFFPSRIFPFLREYMNKETERQDHRG